MDNIMINEESKKYLAEPIRGITSRWLRLFKGVKAYYGVRFREHYSQREKDGKRQADHLTIKEPITDEVWAQHLDGTLKHYNPETSEHELCSLGIFQDIDGECWFSTIDLDVYKKISHQKLAQEVALLGFPLVVSQSSSGGAHLTMTFDEPASCNEVRKTLKNLTQALGFTSHAEFFPKEKGDNPYGNFINMPYYRGVECPAFDSEGNIMTYQQFVTTIEASMVSPSKLKLYRLASQKDIPESGERDGPSRTKAHLWLCRYLKQIHPTNWEDIAVKHNELFVRPTLAPKDVERVHKSIWKNDYTPEETKSTTSTWLSMSKTLSEIASRPKVERVWLVEKLLAFGMIFLSGASTIGKSWFMLQLSYAVATGGEFLGRKVKKGSVLYFAMEDTFDEVVSRYETMGISRTELIKCKNLRFICLDSDGIVPKLTDGYEKFVEDWILNIHKFSDKPQLIVQDTYAKVQKFKGAKLNGLNAYNLDVENLSPSQKMVKKHQVVLVLANHITKTKYSDVWDTIMGSTGIQATSDQMIIMHSKRKLKEPIQFMWRGRYGQGHTLIQQKMNATFEECSLTDLTKLPQRDKDIIKIVEEIGECSPLEVAIKMGIKDEKERQNIQKCMKKLVKNYYLAQPKSGTYIAVAS